MLLILYKILPKVDPYVIPANGPQSLILAFIIVFWKWPQINFTYCESDPSHLTAVESRNIKNQSSPHTLSTVVFIRSLFTIHACYIQLLLLCTVPLSENDTPKPMKIFIMIPQENAPSPQVINNQLPSKENTSKNIWSESHKIFYFHCLLSAWFYLRTTACK